MMNKLAILGASGHGKVAAEIALKQGWRNIEFYDAKWPALNTLNRWQVVGNEAALLNNVNKYDGIFIAIGDNKTRREKILTFLELTVNMVSLIAASAVVSSSSAIGVGVLVAEGAIVNIDSKIANGAIINTNATVDHDCTIDEFVHIGPGVSLAGNVIVGNESMVGIGSTIIQGIKIGKQAIIGAGSVIISDIPDAVTAVGVPATVIKKG